VVPRVTSCTQSSFSVRGSAETESKEIDSRRVGGMSGSWRYRLMNFFMGIGPMTLGVISWTILGFRSAAVLDNLATLCL